MGVLSQLRVAAAHPAVAVSALLTVAWDLVTPLGRPGRDAVYCLRMATEPRAAVRSPYNYRVLLPWPTHWLGGDPWRTYLLLTTGCLAASGPLVYLLFDPWLSDPAAFPLLAACFLALVAGWLWALFRLGYDWSRFAIYAFPVLVPLVDVADGQLTLNHPGPSLAFTAILMTLTALALWRPRLPVRHG